MTATPGAPDPRGLDRGVSRGPRADRAARRGADGAALYSLPGGVVEARRDAARSGAARIAEEVGVEAEILAFVDHVEPIAREGATCASTDVIAAFVGRWRRGEARPAPRRTTSPGSIPARSATYPTTPEPAARSSPRRRALERSRVSASPRVALAAALSLLAAPLAAQTAPPAKPPRAAPATPRLRRRRPTPAPSRHAAALRAATSAASPRSSARSPICAISAATATATRFAPSSPAWSRRRATRKRARTRSPAPSTAVSRL